MKKCDEWERLPVSAVKQYAYCKRRFALMFVDGEWGDNYKIAEGDIFHEKANDPFFSEKRKDRYVSRSVPIFSERLNLYGVIDVVEFLQDKDGVEIGLRPGLWRINPVEYKNGKPEKSKSDNYQLCAQVLCLEEMFCASIATGDVYYGKLRKRITVPLTNELRQKTENIISEANEIIETARIPTKPENQNCNLCSLIDICLPTIFNWS